ncbi:MAG: hypothetical protein FWE25_09005 [Lachnospiraceae bacterium]|nr:hypothetical protein [Lachnospiraceae bacterium]
MTDKELLLAISGIMDQRNDVLREEIRLDMNKLERKIDNVEVSLGARIDNVEVSLNNKIDNVEASLNNKIDNVEASLRNEMNSMKSDLEEKMNRMESGLEEKIRHSDMIVENEVIPIVNELKSLYVDTAERYQKGVIQMETLQSDLDMI